MHVIASTAGLLAPDVLAALVDGFPAAFSVFRLEDPADPLSLRFVCANDFSKVALGVDPAKLIGKTFAELNVGADTLARATLYARVALTGEPLSLPEVFRPADDFTDAGWFSVRVVPLPDRCIGFLAANITERRRAEKRLADQEQFLEAILENLPSMVFVKDAENLRFVRFNRAGEELLGIGRDQMIGKSDHDFFPPDQAAFFVAKDREVLHRAQQVDIAEEPIDTRHGRRWLRTKKVPIAGEDGKPTYLLGISEDVTDARAAEAELRRLKAEAEAASEAKSNFLARMSHEIRTPINAILGMAELVLDSPLQPDQRDSLKTIVNSATALRMLLNDILDFEKASAGKVELREAPFSPRSHIEEVVAGFRAAAHAKRLILAIDVAEHVPEAVIADPLRLRQVLVNLVSNAVKFTDRGGIHLFVGAEMAAAGDGCVLRYRVQDSGVGIRADRQTVIFEAFRQADESTTRAYAGTGLGLAIAKQLVELMGGRISVHSVAGDGTTFEFTVRAELPRAGKVTAVAKPELAQKIAAGLHVLLVEDNPTNVLLMKKLLGRLRCAVTVANNGAEAIACAAAETFGLILMDLQMPGMDGNAAMRVIRSEEARLGRPRVPMIALTAHNMPGDRERCLADGADDFVAKPFAREELLAAMGRAVAARAPEWPSAAG